MENITKDSNPDLWRRLLKSWEDERKPGTVVVDSRMYRVLTPDDDSVIFLPLGGGMDTYYGSMSGGPTKQ